MYPPLGGRAPNCQVLPVIPGGRLIALTEKPRQRIYLLVLFLQLIRRELLERELLAPGRLNVSETRTETGCSTRGPLA
jgi:hypothetical protein